MSKTAHLPELAIGPRPGWELEDDGNQEKGEKQTIPDSFVILQSLRRSRERWLHSTFPRFSTKTRAGKGANLAPPPHTIQTRGKCDLEIGPHVFPETVFYEVHYLLPGASAPTHRPQPASASGSLWQSSTPHNGSYTPYVRDSPQVPQAQMREASSASTSQPTFNASKSSAPLISSLDTVTTITPALINQVNTAASSNPTLANLLQLAAAGNASPDQLKTLGLLIQSLATSENTHMSSATLTDPPVKPAVPPRSYLPPIVREFDLVIEFSESPSERWVFPRGLASCERILDAPSVEATCHTIIKSRFPFVSPGTPAGTSRETGATGDMHTTEPSSRVVEFHLRKAPLAVWDTISRWVGDETKIQENRKLLEAIGVPDRAYLAHHLGSGSLLSELQMASLNTHLKPLKPGPQSLHRTKRKVITTPHDGEIPDNPTVPLVGPKRRRASKIPKKSVVVTPILCFSCGQADVPLIFGGRFCRPCVDSGKVVPPYNYAPHIPPTANTFPQVLGTRPASTQQVLASHLSPSNPPTTSNEEIISHNNKL